MDHFQRIYASQAADYHRMISVEDCDGSLQAAFRTLKLLPGSRVIDLGTGTGRLPLLLAPFGARITGVDLYAEMLRENTVQRSLSSGEWDLLRADMRCLPLASGIADLVTAGWSIGHLRSWFADDWLGQIGRVLAEMRRVVRAGGRLVILETLTTGSLEPAPPTSALAEYYQWLEQACGLQRQVLQTDYAFASVNEAVHMTEFFFGAELAALIRANGWARLPEWTGFWVSEPISEGESL